jgi:AraC-like DNA-binding protein
MVSVRTLLPFYNAFRVALGRMSPQIEDFFRTADPDQRIPLPLVLSATQSLIEAIGDEAFGLSAARHAQGGDFDLLEYFATSAPTHLGALNILGRYFCLLNEASEMDLVERNGRPILRITHCMPMPRYYCDYVVGAYVMTARRWIATSIHEEVWFAHERPENPQAYACVFGKTPVRFGKPFDGIVLAASGLHSPLPRADPKLHRLLSRYAENELSRLAISRPFTNRVRRLVHDGLESGRTSAEEIARQLGLTRRTLTRRLDDEGTTFTILANQVRVDLSRHYLALGDLSVEEIAGLVGFSEPAAFYRAFKRWSGLTPSRYRRIHRMLPPPDLDLPPGGSEGGPARARRSD